MPSAGKVWVVIEAHDKTKTGIESSKKQFKSLGDVVKNVSLGQVAALGGIGFAFNRLAQSSISAASNLSESMNKAKEVFRDSFTIIEEFARRGAEAIGASRQQVFEMTGTIGNLLTAVGLNEKAAAGMSKQILTLAADLASFNNVDITETLNAIRSALVGESEPMRRFGADVRVTRLEQLALETQLISTKKEFNSQVQALAALEAIMRDTRKAQGDFQRTSEGLANSQRILKAQFQDALAVMGEQLLPVITSVVQTVNDLLKSFMELSPGMQDATKIAIAFGGAFLALLPVLGPAGALVGGLAAVAAGIGLLIASSEDMQEELAQQQIEFEGLIRSLITLNETQHRTVAEERNRREIIKTLNENYSDYLGNIDAETIKTTDLQGILVRVNEQLQTRIALMAAQEDLTEQQKKAVEAQKDYNEAIREQIVAQNLANRARNLQITEEEAQVSGLLEARKNAVLDFLEAIDRAGNLSTESNAAVLNQALKQTEEYFTFRLQTLNSEVDAAGQARDRELELYQQFVNQVKVLNSQLLDSAVTTQQKTVDSLSGIIAGQELPSFDPFGISEAELDEGIQAFIQAWIEAFEQRQQAEEESLAAFSDLREEFLMTDQEREVQHLKDRLAAWNENWADTQEGQQIFNAAMKQINAKFLSAEQTQWQAFSNAVSSHMASAIGGYAIGLIDKAFGNFIERQRGEFTKFLAFVVQEFIKAIIRIKIEAAALNIFGGLFGGPFGFLASIFHSGGIVEAPGKQVGGIITAPALQSGAIITALPLQTGMILGRQKARPGMLVSFAPRGADTVPAMLEPGEAVIPKEMVEKHRLLVENLISGQVEKTIIAPGLQGGEILNGRTSPAITAGIAPISISTREKIETAPAAKVNVNLTMNISAIDGESVQQLVSGREFRNAIADVINDSFLRMQAAGVNVEVKY